MIKFIPHDYQKVAGDFILDNNKCGLFLDMGLGKTVTTYTALDTLINDSFEIGKALVIAPKRVAEDTWPSELEKWDHLKNIKVSKVLGTPKERRAALEVEADVYIVTRDNVIWLVDYMTEWDFDTLVIDELSSFKNHQSKRFKKLRTVTPFFKRVIGLTGTPAPNGYMDLWAQIYLLDRGERLGKNITAYRKKFFNAYHRGQYTEYQLRPGAKEEIDSLISDICISMKAKDYLDLKDPIFIDEVVTLNKKEMDLYEQMAKDALIDINDELIPALSAATVSNKLLQLANGAIYDEDKKYHLVHDEKIKALEELIEQSAGENVLVFYNFKSDLERIQEKFKDEVTVLKTDDDIKAWNSGEIKILLAHPASAGHGLNLQQGGSIIVWFSLNWSLELYLQANARLQRQGQRNTVRIYRIIAKGTIDEKVLEVLEGKNIRQEKLLAELKADLNRGG